MVVHLAIPMMNNKMHALCSRRILHGNKFKVSTNVRYVNCKKCCKRLGLDPSLAWVWRRLMRQAEEKTPNIKNFKQAQSLI